MCIQHVHYYTWYTPQDTLSNRFLIVSLDAEFTRTKCMPLGGGAHAPTIQRRPCTLPFL